MCDPPLVILYFVFLIGTVWVDGYVYPDKDLLGLYLINIIVAGIVFWRTIVLQIVIVGLLTWFYYMYAPFRFPHANVIVFQGLTHFLAILSISSAIKYYKREKENTLNLTLTLAKSLDARDKYTALHSENVARYAQHIAIQMGLPTRICGQIHLGGLLHDIGKIGIPESVLMKPTRLTDEEYDLIKQHPVIGYEMVKHITFFKKNGVLDAILFHHERFDGKGYPHGLRGKEIPLIARILAIADSFDAMTSNRVYRDKSNLTHAINQIRKNKGTQFDPEIVDIFLKSIEEEEDVKSILSR
ncbi:HD-GYP domain-containing protein [Brevibacillus reuszeri]|uniref:HD-GYP domain-containing protein n=1 Tax=Brevibacillus reuszeri TaxID=54915 RepID=UPI00289FB9CF|nr:HD-GYP domain-containing protein [Brevibacillus reuszeri]